MAAFSQDRAGLAARQFLHGAIPSDEFALPVNGKGGVGQEINDFGESLLGFAQGFFHAFAFGDVLQKLFVGPLQLMGALADHAIQFLQIARGLPAQAPFFRQGIGQLEDFDHVKGLFEDDHPVGRTQTPGHLVPRVVGIGGADDDLQVRIGFQQAGGGFDPIPARRHAHIHKGQRKRAAGIHRLLGRGQSFLSLIGRGQFEFQPFPRPGIGAEQILRRLCQLGVLLLAAAQNFSEIGVDGAVVINDENAAVGGNGGRGHEVCSWGETGSSRVKVAPWPGPSL